ncbi:endo-1,4-beta-xylanase [Dactylosporangium aurantiacum]|uniref:Beta-xylanase n=1 Tax=Dactylosporangium aurantiacum TaxID=35754 RepID=A0A9Q9IHH7_9ACTN|nr:endo-1,4-beta-xylanase [Dactylosporangium aurantiacum]MDG6101470.1 endo-1,4-beta-xylanase [Dactylosporangium aurantiacum]UWZ52680.1 endo-1,4-beta-xylanase [Dactylosporangium aurantiacum]
MRFTRLVNASVLAVVAVASLSTVAASAHDARPPKPQEQTLRALAARHGLYFGTAVDPAAYGDASDPAYKRTVDTQFSTVTAENAMKWESLEPTRGTYNWGPADALVDAAVRNRQLVRGHVLAWHSQLPAWVTAGIQDGSIDGPKLRALLKQHITAVVTHFKGRIWQWDVVNEAVSDPWETPSAIHLGGNAGSFKQQFADLLGPDYLAEAFRTARAADPKALLFYNDYNIEAFGDGGPGDKTQFVYDMVKRLRADGVPIDGVGSQGHLATQYGNYDVFQVADAMQRFTDLGLAVALTEVDARSLLKNADDPALAANSADVNARDQAAAYNYHVLLQACLLNRHCLSFTVWGFTDKYSWIPTWFKNPPEGAGCLWDAAYNPKKSLRTVQGDLAAAGAPLVQPRIPQVPRQLPRR